MTLKIVKLKELTHSTSLNKVAGGCPHTIHGCNGDHDRTIPENINSY